MNKIMIFDSLIHQPVATPEVGSGECLVETAGYLYPERLISDMINAGMRLQDFRREQYDNEDGLDLEIDPTRRPGFDVAEASQFRIEARKRFQFNKKYIQEELPLVIPQAQAPGKKDVPASVPEVEVSKAPGKKDVPASVPKVEVSKVS